MAPRYMCIMYIPISTHHTWTEYVCTCILPVPILCYTCSSAKTRLSENHSLTGRSECMELTQREADVLTESDLIIPNHLFVYPRLYLADKDLSISSESCCRAIKRNNSCIVYRTDEGPANYGILKKLFFLNDSSVPLSPSPQCYALVQCLSPAPMVLCHDPITQAQLNSHIISFHPPRFTRYS